jgi:hypothetical protein
MEEEAASEISRALLSAYETENPAVEAEWTAIVAGLPDPRAWAVQQPYDFPEAIILTANHICRAVSARPPQTEAEPPQLVVKKYPIDDSIRLFSRPGTWSLVFPNEQVELLLRARPLPPGQPAGRVRALVRAIWKDLPPGSRGTLPPS